MPRVKLNVIKNNLIDFSAWVYSQMKVHGMSQYDLAKYLNMEQPSLSKRLNGTTDWKVKEMFELFKLFGSVYDFKF